jgi:hypothetical protein
LKTLKSPATAYTHGAGACCHSKLPKPNKLSLLLYNDTHAYTLKLENKSRPGITEHFGKTGIVDLDSLWI